MTDNKIENLTVDYLYDELEPGARREFEKAMQQDRALKTEVDEMKSTLHLVREIQREGTLPSLSAAITDRLIEEARAEAAKSGSAEVLTHPKFQWNWQRVMALKPALSFAASLVLVAGLAFYVNQEMQKQNSDSPMTPHNKTLAPFAKDVRQEALAEDSDKNDAPTSVSASLARAPSEESAAAVPALAPATNPATNPPGARLNQPEKKIAEVSGGEIAGKPIVASASDLKKEKASVISSEAERAVVKTEAPKAAEGRMLTGAAGSGGAVGLSSSRATAETDAISAEQGSAKRLGMVARSSGTVGENAADENQTLVSMNRYLELGHQNRRQKNYAEALKNYQMVTALQPDSQQGILAYHHMARTYADSGEAKRALEQYQDVLKRYPAYPNRGEVYFEIGQIYMSLEQPEKALEYLQLAYLNYPRMRPRVTPYLEKTNQILRAKRGEEEAPDKPASSIPVGGAPTTK